MDRRRLILFGALLLGLCGLVMAYTFQPGYVGGNVYTGEIYVDGTVRTLTVPGGRYAQSVSLFNGSAAHVATVPVYMTYGEAPADPTIATPTAGSPTSVDFLDPMQGGDTPGAIRMVKFKTDGTVCYVRFRIVY